MVYIDFWVHNYYVIIKNNTYLTLKPYTFLLYPMASL